MSINPKTHKRNSTEFNEEVMKDLITLQDWLDENGFTRSNFNAIKQFLKEGRDFFNIQGRYFINEEKIKSRIIEIGDEWEKLLKKSK